MTFSVCYYLESGPCTGDSQGHGRPESDMGVVALGQKGDNLWALFWGSVRKEMENIKNCIYIYSTSNVKY